MKKILIIGSKGFIGSHAMDHFSANAAYDCYGCDVVTDHGARNYFTIDAGISDFDEIFEAHRFDVCINCSGAASVPDSLKHPLRDFNLNVFNVVKVLDSIRRHSGSCRFINLSSAAVYGNPESLPVNENAARKPMSPYGYHKLMAEDICKEYAGHFGLHTCSLRIFSAYGPGLKKQLLWDIFQKTLAGKEVLLFGTGKETRDFIYVSDIIRSLELVVGQGVFEGAVYNIANGQEVSVQELASVLLAKIGFNGTLGFNGEQREGDPTRWSADIAKIKQLGYAPAVSLDAGIDRYVQWLREEKLL
ncbi:NAD(P)-dependent oxidoreductase [Ferruginibacter sp. HRS2-29]|uniref:NAD-dependent epimerase/dehydratase family protein n=1 Tax=Ferruginibacter sp. HRS2-29 TaxID=2487334 RepID=UPI0020CBA7CA|nr:NAD-dependent epimerase/dehydratase family protein [Ferruginibacter sp. HRS2-29]MCP9751940.1 NAD-dependent epimerase/dehydratase family protein [Ferruginibacter sp. HRS2-29]